MPITSHRFDDKKRLIYTLTTPMSDGAITEHVTAEQLLSYGPEFVELYQYFHSDSPTLPLEKKREHRGEIQSKIEVMILHYMEEEHYDAAMDIIKRIVTARRQPSKNILLALFDFILRPAMVLRRRTPKEILQLTQEAQRMLFYILECFGPGAFGEIWVMFKPNFFGRLHQRRAVQAAMEVDNDDDEDDEPYECSLTEFDDFWDLAANCFRYQEARVRNQPQTERPSLKAAAGHMRRRMVLDVLITVLEADLRHRRENGMEQCVFLGMIRKDSEGQRTQFDRYLDIIFSAFGSHMGDDGRPAQLKDAEAAEFAGRLLNMLAVLSYSDNLVTPAPLVDQTYRRFTKLDVDSCANLIQIIKCTTFLSAVCDLYLSDSDCSCVPKQYQGLRKGRNASLSVDKLLHFNMRTRPLRMQSLEDVYRHVMVVVWRYKLFFSERSLRCDACFTKNGVTCIINKPVTTVTSMDQIKIIESGTDVIQGWKKHVEEMTEQVRSGHGDSEADDKRLARQIQWAIETLELCM
ncbi:hypothetical protein BJV82DRAFT_164603 [Fennellomyces sp. T-0311]|nr:hypothetical protein BJV82DRAFT_164603 [Fennellomyces sp. T-0311]